MRHSWHVAAATVGTLQCRREGPGCDRAARPWRAGEQPGMGHPRAGVAANAPPARPPPPAAAAPPRGPGRPARRSRSLPRPGDVGSAGAAASGCVSWDREQRAHPGENRPRGSGRPVATRRGRGSGHGPGGPGRGSTCGPGGGSPALSDSSRSAGPSRSADAARPRRSMSSSTVRSGRSPPVAQTDSRRTSRLRQLAAAGLVGDRGVDVPVGDDDRAALEAGRTHVGRRAGRGRRRRASPRTTGVRPALAAVEQDLAQPGADRASRRARRSPRPRGPVRAGPPPAGVPGSTCRRLRHPRRR